MPLENINKFTLDQAPVVSQALASHSVSQGTLEGSSKEWIKKVLKPEDAPIARLELLAQEFFRLIIPHQPETRLLWDPTTREHYILSEKVKGYHEIPTGMAANFADGSYTGLGQAMATAMFLQEIDLKNGNICLDTNNQVIKIDGDWSFAKSSYPGNFDITPDAIANLPYPEFTTYNWLDLVMEGQLYPNSRLVNPQLKNEPQFRAEVNQAMLKICLLPDRFIEKFVGALVQAGDNEDLRQEKQNFVSLLKAQREALKMSALENQSFQTYIHSKAAADDAQALTIQMNSFVPNGDGVVVPDVYQDETAEQVEDNLAKLKYALLVKNIDSLMTKIDSHRVNDQDVEMNKFMVMMKKRITRNINDPDALENIRDNLSLVFDAVSSVQVNAVKSSVQTLRNDTLLIDNMANADRIEDDLSNTPLLERATVIVRNGRLSNTNQDVLTSHQVTGQVTEATPNQTQGYKAIKDRFTKLRVQEEPADDAQQQNKKIEP
jgi:hypothetical protein